MKLCRYDDDKLGVVIGDKVHDVTQAQTEIRNSTPYTAKVDPVIAALPQWRGKLEAMGSTAEIDLNSGQSAGTRTSEGRRKRNGPICAGLLRLLLVWARLIDRKRPEIDRER